jgi:hypothetical protein
MYLELSILIQRPLGICFSFLRDKDTYPQKPGSPVLVLEKTTPGAIDVGTCYREVVQMFPLVRDEIYSVITRSTPPEWLEEDFESTWMHGHLSYQFISEGDGTRLIQCETLQMRGLLRVFEPLVKRMLEPRLRERLDGIKEILETGWQGNQL